MGISPIMRDLFAELYPKSSRRKLQVATCLNVTVSDVYERGKQSFSNFETKLLEKQLIYTQAIDNDPSECSFMRSSTLLLDYSIFPIDVQGLLQSLDRYAITQSIVSAPPPPSAPPNPPALPRKKSGFWFFFFSACSLMIFIIYWTMDPKPEEAKAAPTDTKKEEAKASPTDTKKEEEQLSI